MFGRWIRVGNPMENALELKELRDRIERIENEKPVVAEVCTIINKVYPSWKKLTQDNILDEVDGYVKICFKISMDFFFACETIGRKGRYETENIDGDYHYINSICWVAKDCLIWHDKYRYAKERKRIEKMASIGKGGKK